MGKSKPVDELTVADFKNNPIWVWALDEEENEEQDETWVKPSTTHNFTEELNGSLVSGSLTTQDGTQFPLMCEIVIENDNAIISNVVYYDEVNAEYLDLKDTIKKIQLPVTIDIELTIQGENKRLQFTANKVDIYKNTITNSI